MNQDAFDVDRIGGVRGLRRLVDEVLAAGEQALRLYQDGVAKRATTKADRSPVTEADQAVEARLRAFVSQHYPDAGFLGEETGERSNTGSSLRFVVDPIDGTRAFIRGLPTWSVLVGIEADERPAVGVVFMPARDDLFIGVRGNGAEYNGRTLRVSKVAHLDQALVMYGGLEQFKTTEQRTGLFRVSDAVLTMRGFGDFEGYRQVLLSAADAMIDPGVHPWDICAAKVLIEEAGGRVTAMTGKDSIYENSALGTNGLIHASLVDLLNQH